MVSKIGLLSILALSTAIQISAAPAFRELKLPESLTPFVHNRQIVSNALLIKIGGTNGIVRVGESGLANIPLSELPEPQFSRYWIPARDEAIAAEASRKAEAERLEAQKIRSEQIIATKIRQRQVEETAWNKMAESNMKAATTTEPIKESKADSVATLLLIIGLFIYFLPTIIGCKKRNSGAIFLLNLLLGWTFIGWVVALVWGATKDLQQA